MSSRPRELFERQAHWDAAYVTRGADGVSWFQRDPRISLELFESLGVTTSAAVIDVGGGASVLVDQLVGRGYEDLTVLDVSRAALQVAQRRLPVDAPVTWIHHDLLTWEPERNYDVWHDRAVFHFLVDPVEQDRYMRLLRSVLSAEGAVVLAAFAADGPDHCSGRPISPRRSARPSPSSRIAGRSIPLLREPISRLRGWPRAGGLVRPLTTVVTAPSRPAVRDAP